MAPVSLCPPLTGTKWSKVWPALPLNGSAGQKPGRAVRGAGASLGSRARLCWARGRAPAPVGTRGRAVRGAAGPGAPAGCSSRASAGTAAQRASLRRAIVAIPAPLARGGDSTRARPERGQHKSQQTLRGAEQIPDRMKQSWLSKIKDRTLKCFSNCTPLHVRFRKGAVLLPQC